MFAITRFRYIEVVFHVFYYSCGKKNVTCIRPTSKKSKVQVLSIALFLLSFVVVTEYHLKSFVAVIDQSNSFLL